MCPPRRHCRPCQGCGPRTRVKHRGLQAGIGAARSRERRAASTSRDVMRKRERKRRAHRRCRAYIEVTTTGDAAMFMFKKKLEMPSAAEALPGRPTPIPTAPEHFVLHRPLKGPYPAGFEKAMFGMGCFWGAERKFWELGAGIYITAVGYAAGYTPNPTYEEVCTGRTGHNEVVLAVYDPKTISYERLLKTFWEDHDPTQGMRQGNDAGTQYRSGIYTFTAEQRSV